MSKNIGVQSSHVKGAKSRVINAAAVGNSNIRQYTMSVVREAGDEIDHIEREIADFEDN